MKIQERLRSLPAGALGNLRRGIEKESLRVRADGSLALTPHPAALGSALTHPNITTDFSESQLELITGVHADADGCLQELTEIHQFVVRADEYDPDHDRDGDATRTLGGSYIFRWDANSKVMLAYERPELQRNDPKDNVWTLRYQFAF